jgi:hypothetical protein
MIILLLFCTVNPLVLPMGPGQHINLQIPRYQFDLAQSEISWLSLSPTALHNPPPLRDALHNPSRFVIARPRAVCGVAFVANSTRYWPQNAPCIPSRSALHQLALSYAEHP